MANLIEISGIISKKIFESKDNDFKIYGFLPEKSCIENVILNKYGNISIQGNLPTLIPNKNYQFRVEYQKGKNGYDNYIVKDIVTDVNVLTKEETSMFMAEIIGERNAKTLLSAYPNAIDMIKDNKVGEIDISKLKGIGEKTLNKIVLKINESFVYAKTMAYYKDYELTMTQVKKLHDKFGNFDTIKKKMNENPYGCLCSLAGIGFTIADSKIINNNPLLKNSYFRMLACITDALNENENAGNTVMNYGALKEKCEISVYEAMEHFNKCIKEEEKKFIYIQDDNLVAKTKTYMTELMVAQRMKDLFNTNNVYDIDYSHYTEIDGNEATDEQKKVLELICNHSLVMLSGFGGTGKSFSMALVTKMLEDAGKEIIFLAPTGKASKVLADYVGKDASTIHRGLGFKIREGLPEWEYNEENPLPYDVVLVDESSMIDIFLMNTLLKAINPETTKLLMVADNAQLQSVGCGAVVESIVSGDKIPMASLTKVFRYGEGGLARVAMDTRNGKRFLDHDKQLQVFGDNKDFTFFNRSKETALEQLLTVYSKLLERGVSKDDIMILSAYNKGEYGTYNINRLVQDRFNKETKSLCYTKDGEQICFRTGDLVIQIVNSYEVQVHDSESKVNVFNGDSGKVIEIFDDEMLVEFDGNLIMYDMENIKKLLLGYAISVHKSQGSSARLVILLTCSSHYYMLSRNLLYVAFTRAKEKVYCIGEPRTIDMALRKSDNVKRQTLLRKMLDHYIM